MLGHVHPPPHGQSEGLHLCGGLGGLLLVMVLTQGHTIPGAGGTTLGMREPVVTIKVLIALHPAPDDAKGARPVLTPVAHSIVNDVLLTSGEHPLGIPLVLRNNGPVTPDGQDGGEHLPHRVEDDEPQDNDHSPGNLMGNTHGHQKALSAVGCPNEPVDDISNDLEEFCKECDDLFHGFNLTQ